ncbi:MAG: metallophosphoesterase [Saprospiraceae bacterium]
MPHPLRILQVTDLHVGKQGEETFGVDVRDNFLKILDAAVAENPDFLVLTGDLAYDVGENEIYEWMYKKLQTLSFPYYIISGNHDDTVKMATVFGQADRLVEDELYYSFSQNGYRFIFLDTAKAYCREPQYDWLKNELANTKEPVVTFMHHPPVYGGVPYMDNNHAFQEMEKMQEVLSAYDGNMPIYCGHYHADKILVKNNLTVHITPSCFFQIDDRFEAFQVDHHKIAYRRLHVDEKGVRSTLRYLG